MNLAMVLDYFSHDLLPPMRQSKIIIFPLQAGLSSFDQRQNTTPFAPEMTPRRPEWAEYPEPVTLPRCPKDARYVHDSAQGKSK